ncbi:hypothetical protein [Nocardioides dilutus]
MTQPANEPSASQPPSNELERLSDAEIGKDSIQAAVEAAAGTVGEVATIITSAVRDVATALGGFATEVFEIRDAAKKAQRD